MQIESLRMVEMSGVVPASPNARTRFHLMGIVGVSLFLAVGFCAGCRSASKLTDQQAEGQHLYVVRCAHCHEDNDLGLKPPPPNIHGALQRKILPSGAPTTDVELRRLLMQGKGKMPSFAGRFTNEQFAALSAYLRTDMPLPE